MSTPRARRLILAAAAALAGGVVAALAGSGPAIPPPRRELFKDSRAQLAMARANGRRDVSVVVAAKTGRTDAVAREMRRLGARIRVEDDDLGYLRGRVPVDRVEELVAFDAVEAADLDVNADTLPPYFQPGLRSEDPERRLPRAAPGGDEWPPSRTDLTLRPIYSPLRDLGALEWRREHPTFDGRGVTVAVLDGNSDFLLPELQVARTLDGQPTRKVIDVVNAMDPLEPESDFPHWVSMRQVVRARDGKVSYAGETYLAPRAGTFRIGVFDLCRFAAYVQAYFRIVLDRPGEKTSVDKPVGVLWDEATGEVWVDTNQNGSFADEKALHDFARGYEYGTFGTDDPETPVRETLPFTVQTDKADGFVAVNLGMYGHSTMVSGAVVGSRGTDGYFDGVAPGARLVSIFEGETTHGMIEGLIRAFRDPRVDVVLLEEDVYIAMPYVLSDGRFTVTVLCSRLIDKYKKPFLVPANNSPGLSTAIEHGLARYGFGVGAYESRENFLANKAIRVFDEDNLHWVGSWGPSGNGSLQPDVLAPSEVLTTYPASRPGDDGLAGVFEFRPGYAMCGGTSCATPVASGAMALLISGAKQTGLAWDPPGLYRAVTATARYLSNQPAYRQGNGLIQVGAAWDFLRKASGAAPPVEIESRAAVRTVNAPWLEPPGTGPGLYEREGWTAGDHGERSITFTRRSGPSSPAAFRVKWTGNDGTFTSADTITLPLGQPVDLAVEIAPASTGVHSALLSLESPDGLGPSCRLMTAIVAAERFDAANKYTVTRDVRAPRPGEADAFFDVPPGIDAVKFELRAPKDTVRMELWPPDGREDTVFQMPQGDVQTRTIADPEAGVWSIVLFDMHDAFKFDEKRPTTLPRTPVTLTASLIGVGLTAPAEAPGAPGTAREIRVTATNKLAAFKGSISSFPLASVRESRETLGPRQQKVFDLDVPKGTVRLMAELADVPASGADLDLYLFDCTSGPCQPRRACVAAGAREAISLDAPAPGSWKAVVDVPRAAGPISFTFRDFFFDPALGSISVADGSKPRDVGASWSAPASLWVVGKAPEGRTMCGVVAAAGEGIALSRLAASLDFGAAEYLPKVGNDAIPLGLSLIHLGEPGATPAGDNR
jgi:hypothetical protein